VVDLRFRGSDATDRSCRRRWPGTVAPPRRRGGLRFELASRSRDGRLDSFVGGAIYSSY